MLFQIKHEYLARLDNEQMNAYKQLKKPAHGGVLHGLAFLVGKRLLLLFEGLTEAVFQGGLEQQREGHDPHQRHDAFGRLQIQGRGQEQRVFEEAKAPFHFLLVLVGRNQLLIR
jgi:hypothetical protein